MARKGKQVAGKGSSGKRKVDDDDKTGGGRKRRNRGVLQFFEDAADEVGGDDSSDDSIFDDEGFMEEEDAVQNLKNDAFKAHNLPVFPKEEQFEEEFDKIMEARYRDGSALVRFADEYDAKDLVDGGSGIPSIKDPMVWKVKCTVGREKNSAFCLMQKYVDLMSLGNKIQIISAFAIDHVKGYIYIEADRQSDVIESCRGLCSIYTSRVAPVPKNEVSHLLSVRSKRSEVSVGMWARVKNGKYKGDLAQVVAVNDERSRATVKLIPRIDLQAMAEKFGGGVSIKRTAVPAPRLISSSELEEFRTIIQYRRDRDTGKHFEVLDGLMLKDGYLYKRMSLEALSFWSVMPSEEELLKFQPSESNESGDVEWLSQLYGDKKKKRTVECDKGGEKGDGSLSSNSRKKYELYELVSLGGKDFGLIVGFDKDDSYKILREGSKGNEVLNVGFYDIKNGPFEGKFTAFDQHKKAISVNDSVRVLEGPSKDKEGIVKQVYRGIIFLYNENEEENGGYTCCKAQCCEKMKARVNACSEKGAESGFFGFDDSPSSPKSPLSPKKSWQARENNDTTRGGDKDGPFSVGQTSRIRVGPLKGYLCRVIAVRRSDITVKLDSQQKVLTVKPEHLAELRGRSTAISNGVDPDSSTSKPFDLFGNEGCSTDWIGGAGASAGGGGWNAGGSSATGSSWPSFSASGLSGPTEHNSADPSSSAGFDSKKDVEDNGWERKVAPEQHSTWGKAISDDKVASANDQIGGWGKGDDMWNKASTKGSFGGSSSGSWGKGAQQTGDAAESSKIDAGNWGNATLGAGNERDRDVTNKSAWKDSDESWGRGKEDNAVGWDKGSWNKPKVSSTDGGSWNNWNNQDASSSLGKAEEPSKDSRSWGGAKSHLDSCSEDATFGEKNKDLSDNWGKQAGGSWKRTDGSSWNAAGEGSSLKRDEGVSSWKKQDGVSSWNKLDGGNEKDGSSTWGKQADSFWDKTSKGLSWAESQGESKRDGGSWERDSKNSSWGVQDGGSSWDRSADERKQVGGSWTKDVGISCNKAGGVSSWSKQADAHKEDGGSWGKGDGGSSWGKQTGGSLWDKQGNEDQSDKWSTPQTVGGDQGRRDWGKEKKDDSNNQDSWERQKTFDRGRGSGGRRGRGGQQGGGRFGRGRSYGQDSSSGWKYEGDGAASWVKEKGSGNSWGSSEGSWGKGKVDSSGVWGQGGYESRDQRGSWNKPKSFGADGGSWNRQDEGSSWSKPVRGSRNDAGGNSSDQEPKADFASSWGNNEGSKSDWAKPKESWEKEKGDSGASGWSKGKFSGNDQTDSWNKPKISSGGSSWNNQGENTSWNEKAGDTSRAGDDKWDDMIGNLNKSSSSAAPWGKNKLTSNAESSSRKSEESCDTGNADSGADALNQGGSTGQEMDQWSKPKASNAAGGSRNKSGGSWNEQDKDSSYGKQDGGSSWSGLGSGKNVDGRKKTDCSVGGEGFGGWNKGWSGNKYDSDGGSWNKNGGSFGKESGESAWGKQGGGSSWAGQESGNNGDGWKKTENSGGGEGYGGWKKGWSGNRDDLGGGSWNKDGGSWKKETGDSSWGKQGGRSSWAGQGSGNNGDGWKKTESSGGEGSGGWNKGWSGNRDDADGGSWNKTGGSSNKESGDSSWGKQGGGSSWAGQGSGTSGDGWKKTESSGGEGSGGWKKGWSENMDDADGSSWERPRPYDGGQGWSGGRRGTGGGQGGN